MLTKWTHPKIMKKLYFSILVLLGAGAMLHAQVTGMPAGYTTTSPTVSTAENPVWYNMMATNTDAVRANRYILWDGTDFKSELFNSPGITDDLQHDKYLWRLEQGPSGAGYVVLVHKTSGLKINAPSSAGINTILTLAETGNEWKMTDASAKTTGTVAGQYALNYEGWTDNRYLNAGDGVNMSWKVLTFNTNGSCAKSSGWFFYPVTSTKTVTFSQPDNGNISIKATNGTSTLSAITTGGSVLVGTAVTVQVTRNGGYAFHSLVVNDVDVTSSVVDGSYTFIVNTNTTVSADFSVATGFNQIQAAAVYPNPFKDQLNISNRNSGSPVDIFDMTGRKVLSQNADQINTNTLVQGCYIIKYKSNEGIAVQKITKY